MELKSRRISLIDFDKSNVFQNSSATFACMKVKDLRVGIVKTEDFLTKVRSKLNPALEKFILAQIEHWLCACRGSF